MANAKIAMKILIAGKDMEAYKALTTVAAKARMLLALKHSRGDISRFMTEQEGKEVRYQWIRNIELTPLKRQG